MQGDRIGGRVVRTKGGFRLGWGLLPIPGLPLSVKVAAVGEGVSGGLG